MKRLVLKTCVDMSEKSAPYHGEIMAIKQALVKCLSLVKKRKRNKIHLLSDCQSAILTVTSCVPNDNCTQEITDILKISHDLLSEGTKTSISWIGGHADIEGNEISDKAAKEGALKKDQPLSTSTTFKGIKKTIQRNSERIWQMTWNNTKTGLHLKEIQDKVSLKATHALPRQRKIQKIFHQLRIGRSDLNAQDPINKKEDEEKRCFNCGAIEDTRHYLLQCPRYAINRSNMMNKIYQTLFELGIRSENQQMDLSILGHHIDLPMKARQDIATHIGEFIVATKRFSNI